MFISRREELQNYGKYIINSSEMKCFTFKYIDSTEMNCYDKA